jgi:hypothetical protein
VHLRRAIVGALSLGLTALTATAAAQDGPRERSVYQSPRLWATVNLCDTTDHPDAIGIRGSMPGSGVRAERMLMRFQVQFFTPADGRWHNTGALGDSGFVDVGSGRFRARESGRTFTITPPQGGGAFRLRGVVTFEWRRGGDVVRRARKRTRGGHPNTAGADPAGFSAPVCEVR